MTFTTNFVLLLAVHSSVLLASSPTQLSELDRFEAVDSPENLAWVQAQNTATLNALSHSQAYQDAYKNTLAYVNFHPVDSKKSPLLHRSDAENPRDLKYVVDAQHPRGVLRKQNHAGRQITLDLATLGAQEQKRWTYRGHSCAASSQPTDATSDRCLIYLSDGGGDAFVLREYDFGRGRFVEQGFQLPAARHVVQWVDQDLLLLGTDWGPGSLSSSGFARQLKLWQRGQPLTQARLVFDGHADAVSVNVFTLPRSSRDERLGQITVLQEIRTFFDTDWYLWQADRLIKVNKPNKADLIGQVAGQLLFELKQPWPEFNLPQGALIGLQISDLEQGISKPELIYQPSPSQSVEQIEVTRDFILLSVTDQIFSRLVRLQRSKNSWQSQAFTPLPAAHFSLSAADTADNQFLVHASNYLQPALTFLLDAQTGVSRYTATGHSWFDASGFVQELRYAVSADGTRVPYILVRPRASTKAAAPLPLIMDIYGGFGISRTPVYNGGLGQDWLAHGGAYVVANVRGGGEFGSTWHQAATGVHKIRTVQDITAVAEDLIAHGITTPNRLGVKGQSNGGLMACAAMVYRPELYHAVSCDVPLTDMLRYPELLAGASWLAEYGDPANPAQRAAILQYAPLQNLKAGQPYPTPLLQSSTRDDRVHPAHARKFVARMQQLGYPAWYFENNEGGHAGATTPEQIAQMWALQMAYFHHQLMATP